MAMLDFLLGRTPKSPEPLDAAPVAPIARHRFSVGSDIQTWNALIAGAGPYRRIPRWQATQVPACKRARDLICGVISSLPLQAVNAAGEPVTHALLEQPEILGGLTRSVTLARTLEDLLFEGSALWLVVLRTSSGYPQAVEHIRHGRWSQQSQDSLDYVEQGEIKVAGRTIDPADCILFTSACDPLLLAGAPAIANLLQLERTAANYADTPEASAYFQGEVDPADPDEIAAFLNDWRDARRAGSVAYVPAALQLKSVTRMTAEELQLAEARNFSITEIARLTGIHESWLSVNVGSRTYLNSQDERRSFIDFTLSPFIHSIEERLSLGDVTPRGHRVQFNLNGFLRASTLERYQSYAVAITSGFMTVDEVRSLEDRPALGAPNA